MTIDSIINKYGAHDLDVNFCIKNNAMSAIFAYCHQHNINGQFMVNHYLKIIGKFTVLKFDVDDVTDVYIHIASVNKIANNVYAINGVGGYVEFSVDSELIVEALSQDCYNKQLNDY
jgi:hypothetical protein